MPDLLETYLHAADAAGKVIAHAGLLVRLAALYQQLAPQHLGEASRLANFKSGIIVIHADNGAVAAKLRQMAPTLADAFSQRGVECSGVQVKVLASERREQGRDALAKPLSAGTSLKLSALRDSLPVSPLREAIENLLVRSARKE